MLDSIFSKIDRGWGADQIFCERLLLFAESKAQPDLRPPVKQIWGDLKSNGQQVSSALSRLWKVLLLVSSIQYKFCSCFKEGVHERHI